MEETAFDIDRGHVAEASRRFPAHRLPHREERRGRSELSALDLSYLAGPAAEFGRHAWDESGH